MSKNNEGYNQKYRVYRSNKNVQIPVRTLTRWGSNLKNSNLTENDSNEFSNFFLCEDGPNSSSDDSEEYSDDQSSKSSDSSSDSNNSVIEDFQNSDMSLQFDENDNTDSDNEKDEIENSKVAHELLYMNSKQTTDEGVLSLLRLYIKNKLTKTALKDILQTTIELLPVSNNMPKTVYRLFQYVKQLSPFCTITKHFYCRTCCIYYGENVDLSDICKVCTLGKDYGSFLDLNLLDQIKFLFEHENLADIIDKNKQNDKNDGTIRDITDGSEYIRVNYSHPHKRKCYDLTLILNTDGLSLKKSSKQKFWAVMCTVAEIPKHLRSKFIIVIQIWYDKMEPLMNTYLQPLSIKLNKGFQEGVTWIHPRTKKEHLSTIVAPVIIADAPARAKVLNMHNFNGRFGCNICEIRTKKCANVIEGKRQIRVFSKIDNLVLRTTERLRKQEEIAMRKQSVIRGVKGKTIISTFPLVDRSTFTLPEFLHSMLLGSVLQFTNLWLNKNGDWCVKNDFEKIDKDLLSIRPPDYFEKLPRSLVELLNYKAMELYNWLLYYSVPIMKKYLPDKFFQHWLLLVIGLYSLLKDEIKISEIDQAEIVLRMFVRDIEVLYGKQQLTYNNHQILHLALSVRRWGPLHVVSAFMFEDFNGIIASLNHGTNGIGKEIVNNLLIAKGVKVLENKVNDRRPRKNNKEINISVLGKNLNIINKLNDNEKILLEEYGQISNLKFFLRVNIFNEIYTSEYYKELKTNSYNVELTFKDGTKTYGSIRFYFEDSDEVVYLMIRIFNIVQNKIFYNVDTKLKVEHILPVNETNEFLVVSIKNINTIKKVIRVGKYICKTPNSFRKLM